MLGIYPISKVKKDPEHKNPELVIMSKCSPIHKLKLLGVDMSSFTWDFKGSKYFAKLYVDNYFFLFIWYKVHLRVADSSGDTTLFLFNKEVEKLINSIAGQLLDKQNWDFKIIPSQSPKFMLQYFCLQSKSNRI